MSSLCEISMFRWTSRWLIVSLISAIFIETSSSFYYRVLTEPSDLPINIHLTWQQSNMSIGITVTWQTTHIDSGSQVLYDNVSRNGNPSLYRHVITGTSHTYAGASGYIHDVQLTGLRPDSTYYFVCGGEQGGYSGERSFRTAPVESSHLRIIAGGDCRTNWTIRDEISKRMSELNPDFVLLAGDLVTSGSNQTQWNSFFESLHEYWLGTNNLTIPIIPCLGNHEKNATNYYEQFALPGNEQWFSFNWGEQVHIAVLNSEADPSGKQLIWLENDLESHQNYTWKIVMFHRPLFSASHHGSWIEGREAWCPLFDKYRVDIVFAGHDHNYERSQPINYTASKTSPQASYSTGTMYIVTGGWGAPLHNSGSNWWTANSASKYHFVVVDIFPNGTLTLQAKDTLGLTFDEVAQKMPIIPELSPMFVLPLTTILMLLAVILRRRKAKNRQI